MNDVVSMVLYKALKFKDTIFDVLL